jgi:ubiquinol-cytochrome c reductase iron-sulfur subunit
MSWFWRSIVLVALWRLGGLRSRGQTADSDPSERRIGAARWAELLVAGLLLAVPVTAVAFVALFVLDPDTQLLGLALGATLALIAGALVVAGRWIVPQETRVEQRPEPAREATQLVDATLSGADGITRRRLLAGAAGAAGVGFAAALVVPVVSLGPGLEGQLRDTPWHAGRALVDDQGEQVLAASILERGFLTAFPEGADRDNLGSPVVVVRVDPATLTLPASRAGWAPGGILAYSKICTHAACAISLFRAPLSPTTQSRGPALVCPCHYSTFNVLDGGGVEFGPAGRALPQLPLRIDAAGVLRAAGPMSGPVGPSWWGDPT